MSNEYEEENHEVLNAFVTKIAKNVRYLYLANDHDEEDFKSIAFEYILKYGGLLEKNLYYDSQKLNIALIKNLSYVMKNYYKKLPKEKSLMFCYEGKEYLDEELLIDERYNPEFSCWQETYDYLKTVDEIHCNIVRDIQKDCDFAINYREKCFSKIAYKYNLSEKKFEEILAEIEVLIIKNGLVKLDKHGKVISMLDVND